MSDQDLAPTPNGGTTTNTPEAERAPGANPNRARRNNRRPARTTPNADDTTATPTNTLTEAETAPEATPSAPRARRGGRGRGANKNARPDAEAETRAPDAPNPAPETDDAATNDSPVVAPSIPAQSNLSAETAPAPVAAPEAPTPATESAVPVATEQQPAAQPSRYRFDRRGYNATFPNSPAAPKAEAPVPPGELRRSGAFSSLFARPAPAPAAPPAPAEEEPPQQPSSQVVTPEPPRAAAPSAPAFARPAPLHVVEPEEITLPRTPSVMTPPPSPAPTVAPEATASDAVEEETENDAESITGTDLAGQSGERRNRRRRRGRNGNGNGTHDFADEASERGDARTERPAAATAPAVQSAAFVAPAPQTPAPRTQPSYTAPTPVAPEPSPYGSPEPSYARGFGPVTRGMANEYRAPTAPSHSRFPRNEGAPISANQLASVITEALQQQTDRLLAEQHRHGSAPTFTIAMPSTERVGVFVDVANLLYSSRSMRIPIDFGKLLQFLKGDRRLVRAHAYAPTSPDPYADQQFLQAVKGLGYRITTKDYKTFSSGAKKADLDLDLCMGIVRIVDAGAVDTIVLVSGDSDFLPVLDYCSDHGVRVEVAAFDESTAAILRQSCDLFLNLSVVEAIRA